jgi:hypothetical protein
MPNFRGSPRVIRAVLPLGTGAVTTQTKLIGMSEVRGRVREIRFAGQGAVTGTSITAAVHKLSADGNTSTSLQSAARDIKLTTGNDETKITASLASNRSTLVLTKDQLLECIITAGSITAGPGDVVVEIVVEPLA